VERWYPGGGLWESRRRWPLLRFLSRSGIALAAEKPNSNFNGVQIGTITYSYRGMPGTAEDLLKYITRVGISSVELMGEPVEQYAGIPSRAPVQVQEVQATRRRPTEGDDIRRKEKPCNSGGGNPRLAQDGFNG
jgi:hypothetical protein